MFSPDEDVALGLQMKQQIFADPQQFPIADPQQYPEAYAYLNSIVNQIIESGSITYRDKFAWEVYIIRDDETLNAFATPGGYIYVYSGLIKYLDKEDDLAGVLGHEIAHADLRHSTRQLQKVYGLNVLLSLILGGQNSTAGNQLLTQIVGNLTALSFSRDYEREADSRSVEYLAGTKYECDAAKSFFVKLSEENKGGQPPAFLSTHPNPEDRIAAIENKANAMGCTVDAYNPASFRQFKSLMP